MADRSPLGHQYNHNGPRYVEDAHGRAHPSRPLLPNDLREGLRSSTRTSQPLLQRPERSASANLDTYRTAALRSQQPQPYRHNHSRPSHDRTRDPRSPPTLEFLVQQQDLDIGALQHELRELRAELSQAYSDRHVRSLRERLDNDADQLRDQVADLTRQQHTLEAQKRALTSSLEAMRKAQQLRADNWKVASGPSISGLAASVQTAQELLDRETAKFELDRFEAQQSAARAHQAEQARDEVLAALQDTRRELSDARLKFAQAHENVQHLGRALSERGQKRPVEKPSRITPVARPEQSPSPSSDSESEASCYSQPCSRHGSVPMSESAPSTDPPDSAASLSVSPVQYRRPDVPSAQATADGIPAPALNKDFLAFVTHGPPPPSAPIP